MALLLYYSVISIFFIFASSDTTAFDSYNNTISLNDSAITGGEQDSGGFFASGISFGRFVGLITIGVGLPSDTPSFVSVFWIVWQSLMTIFTIGFVISSIWNG